MIQAGNQDTFCSSCSFHTIPLDWKKGKICWLSSGSCDKSENSTFWFQLVIWFEDNHRNVCKLFSTHRFYTAFQPSSFASHHNTPATISTPSPPVTTHPPPLQHLHHPSQHVRHHRNTSTTHHNTPATTPTRPPLITTRPPPLQHLHHPSQHTRHHSNTSTSRQKTSTPASISAVTI